MKQRIHLRKVLQEKTFETQPGFFLLRHFGHLSQNSTKTRENSNH